MLPIIAPITRYHDTTLSRESQIGLEYHIYTAANITVAASIKRMPTSNLEKIRLVLAFLRESPMESEAVLSVVIF